MDYIWIEPKFAWNQFENIGKTLILYKRLIDLNKNHEK